MKKVVHLNATAGGGAFVMAQRLSEALNATGQIESEHLVFTGNPGPYQLFADGFVSKKWAFGLHAAEKLDFLRHEKNKEIRFAFSHGLTGVNILKHTLVQKADIVHLHWINKGFISLNGLEKLYRSGKKIIWTAHDLWPFTGGCYHPRGCDHFHNGCGDCKYLQNPSPHDLSYRVMNKKRDIYSRFAPIIVVPGQWSYDMAHASDLAVYAQLEQISNFVDTSVFKPLDAVAQGLEKKGKIKLLFSSMNLLNPKKGIYDLVAAIDLLAVEEREQIELVLIGHAKDALPAFGCDIRELGVISDTQSLVEAYQGADVYLSPSYEETFGLTVVEAQACGLPVIAYSAGELAYNVVNEKTGWLCEIGDTPALAKAIAAYIQISMQERLSFQKNAREFVLQRFDLKQSVGEYLDLYSRV